MLKLNKNQAGGVGIFMIILVLVIIIAVFVVIEKMADNNQPQPVDNITEDLEVKFQDLEAEY